MNIVQLVSDFFFGAIRDDMEIAKDRGERVPVQPWQIMVVVSALIVGVALGVKTLLAY